MESSTFANILLPIAVIQFVGWATPGPNHLTIISASVVAGRSAGLKAAMGIAAGALAWSLIAVSGIAVVFKVFPQLYLGLRLIGAGYLIFLGISAFRAAKRGGVFNLEPDISSPVSTAPFRTAFLVMMTNPKSVLFFGSILTAFIPPDGPRWLLAAIPIQFGIVGAVLNASAALFFSLPAVVQRFQAAGFTMSIVFGLLFCGLGLLVTLEILGYIG